MKIEINLKKEEWRRILAIHKQACSRYRHEPNSQYGKCSLTYLTTEDILTLADVSRQIREQHFELLTPFLK